MAAIASRRLPEPGVRSEELPVSRANRTSG